MASNVKPLPVSAEALSRLTTLANDVTIDVLQRAEMALVDVLEPWSNSTLIAMLYGPRLTPAERERILQLLEAKP